MSYICILSTARVIHSLWSLTFVAWNSIDVHVTSAAHVFVGGIINIDRNFIAVQSLEFQFWNHFRKVPLDRSHKKLIMHCSFVDLSYPLIAPVIIWNTSIFKEFHTLTHSMKNWLFFVLLRTSKFINVLVSYTK